MPPIVPPTTQLAAPTTGWGRSSVIFQAFHWETSKDSCRDGTRRLSSLSTALKTPGRARKHFLAGHTGTVWGGRVRKLLKSDDLLLKSRQQWRQVKVPRQPERHWVSTERGSAASQPLSRPVEPPRQRAGPREPTAARTRATPSIIDPGY